MDQGRNITEVLTQFDDNRNRYTLLDITDDTSIQLFYIRNTLQICFHEKDVQFQGIGTSLFNLTGEICPGIRFVTVHTGNDRNRTQLFRLPDQIQIIIYLVSLHVTANVIHRFRIILILHQGITLSLDLFFEKRFQHNSTGTSLLKLFVTFSVVSQSRTTDNYRIAQCKSRILGF